MNKAVKQQILDKIKEYDSIMLFRHVRNDGDCVGSTKGLKRIINLTWPEKAVYIIDPDYAEYLTFMGKADEDVCDEIYEKSLGIVIDTACVARISNPKYTLCKELIKIDHHIPLENYGDIMWVEEERSSACEMIADFYATFRDELKIDSQAATDIYTGMVTDSGRFKYEAVNGDTLRNAAIMLDQGINTELLFSNLYLKSFEELAMKAKIYDKMKITENGVAYIFIDKAFREENNLSAEQASSFVSSLEKIKGAICWLLFNEQDEQNVIRVRLRSRFVHINPVAEKYNGGGHACASGATVYSWEEAERLVADADAHVKEYKETHEGWL
jgi:phosphoesterase RecJ-like protein